MVTERVPLNSICTITNDKFNEDAALIQHSGLRSGIPEHAQTDADDRTNGH